MIRVLRSTGAVMASHTIERQRGAKEARQQLAVLREKWPLAFPVQRQDVRPLAVGAAGEIAAGMGWSLPYTLGVLTYWKMAPVYCQAVLPHDQRITLDGTPAEAVDAGAKDLATKQLAKLAARTPRSRPRPPRQSEAEAGPDNREANAVARSGAGTLLRRRASARPAENSCAQVAILDQERQKCLPVRARRMAFWERPTPALADR